MEVPSKVVTNCHLTNVPQPFGSTPSSFICAHHCLSNTACTAFCILDSSCVLVNALAVPSGSRTLQQASNGSCFAPFLPSRPTGEDLARGKSVRVNGKWDAKYADGSTVVSGSRCEVTKYDCFCSALSLTSYLIVDLGNTMPVTTIVVKVSEHFPSYFEGVKIRVGDMGSKEDTLMMTYEGSPQAGEELLLGGTTTLRGRYVSLYRSDYSMCLCLLQVYKA
ncbi:uncharacterized protein LOC126994797 isoform X2 [Eriocheir sinensis]|nr:uncharacterized protein LOC126994797 isoform X2 [Eriocheir sinensis]XP_050710048.1 uncharacterized protein LOC126994797 isoform X2 [Eriocheir sinensis]